MQSLLVLDYPSTRLAIRCCFHIMSLEKLTDIYPKYVYKQKENLPKSLAFLQCMTTNFSRRRHDIFEVTEPILNKSRFLLINPPTISGAEVTR